ncbi:cytochrome P450 [Nocardia sp. NPDC003963]
MSNPPSAPSSLCPILRNYQPFAPEHLADPYPVWRLSHQQAPVFYVPSAGFWAVTGYDEVLQVARDTGTFTSRNALNFKPVPARLRDRLTGGFPQAHPALINTDPPQHTRLRRAANRVLTPAQVKRRLTAITTTADALIDAFAGNGTADIVSQFAVPLPARVIAEIIGVEPDEQENFQRWSDDAFLMANPTLTDDEFLRCATSMAELKEYLEARIDERRIEPGDDLISSLLASESDELTTEQIISITAQLLIGGNVTTTDLIGNAVLTLLSDPARWSSVCRDRDAIPSVIEEVLRLESPVRGLFRTTTSDVELGGVLIPSGSTIWVVFAAANHDESVFPRAGEFDPHRDNLTGHLAFGRGTHFCIGAPLAREEVRIALELLAARLPGLALVEGQQLSYPASPISRGVERLEVAWNG